MKKWLFAASIVLLAGCAEAKEEQQTASCEAEVKVSVVDHVKDKTLFNKDVCLNEKDTALDALEDTTLDVVKTGKGEMAYVTAVDGIREKSAGAGSGWVFGSTANQAKSGPEVMN